MARRPRLRQHGHLARRHRILGVYRTVDGGESWHPFDDGLPNVFITDLDLRAEDTTLFAATMGRGLYKRHVA